jgi:hypothetical protein
MTTKKKAAKSASSSLESRAKGKAKEKMKVTGLTKAEVRELLKGKK